jgi:hypothetical protein
MLRSIILLAGVALLTGCVSTKTVPLQKDTISSYQGRTIAVSSRERPAFAAMTAGKAMFGAIGGAAMVMAGNKIVEENEVQDPAQIISQKLLETFSTGHSLKLVSTDGVIAKGMKVDDLSKQYSGADILLDVQTTGWNLAYFPTDWNSYRVIYAAKLRIIDTHKSKVLAEGFCSRVPEKTDSAPSYDQLLENKADRLKQELALAAEFCVNEFRSKVLVQT